MKKVMIIIPALNEEEAIGKVIAKVPRNQVEGVKFEVLVIDDGSTDRTIEVAKEHGADYIISHADNWGLGATIRQGLEWAYEQGADIGVMIDSDNEYPADEIDNLINPILKDKADYVLGSRFMKKVRGMTVMRRLGNYVFTLLQSILLGRWITDGQTGMRAFSREVMRDFRIIHDYNYAQVITLNILRQGYRLGQVPINYSVRETGDSFIKFREYMTQVLPAIWEEMTNSPEENIKIIRKEGLSTSVRVC
ncbi:Glycosyltransferase involved in cell wall bisynthesis [Candidatus Frackibacter sp. WG12]|uniref:glycosyltransferase family 2 protein n=1 Tax=unclassified Candidatus Frackibacter TaxID=2648818 RepID=UPI000886795D|nr:MULTISPECIES: glycosyltransferase family 2 protein [unclassified Candidatus Frackibacter]SDC77060.1 Glycosyltransferase involved in cell wall bisynthesis [Candidatus Frackibacter sp. WG11]SEM90211.1 Glycosyltransferase involved in cell wall bisynthesis [Candidatus Frackibacter sp. WG12]SFM00477.1 Glycosyltransferase involved in cell wall bisynthesis [Candidatus Frackibacter sp. WG13]